MSGKFEVKPFNDLPYEKRVEICYYANLNTVQELMTILERNKDDITPSLKIKLKKLIDNKKEFLEKEYVEVSE